MKSKASPSQIRRAAEDLLKAKGFLMVDQFDHPKWPKIRASIQKNHKLIYSTEGGAPCLRS